MGCFEFATDIRSTYETSAVAQRPRGTFHPKNVTGTMLWNVRYV
jgi:hypothetical protein